MQKPTLGHIDCPFCGASDMMRISHDRNGKPFGHCEDCDGQMRVGGKPFREKKFIERYPFAAPPKAPEIPVTVTGHEVPEKPPAAQPAAPVTAPEQKQDAPPKAPRNSLHDALAFLGGGK